MKMLKYNIAESYGKTLYFISSLEKPGFMCSHYISDYLASTRVSAQKCWYRVVEICVLYPM